MSAVKFKFIVLFSAALLLVFSGNSMAQTPAEKEPSAVPPGGEILAEGEKAPLSPPPLIESIRNPFVLPEGVYLKSAVVQEQPPDPVGGDLILQAIMIGSRSQTATISNYIYQVGDIVNGKKIVDIEPDQVVLEDDDERLVLRLNRQPFRLGVRQAKPPGNLPKVQMSERRP